MNKFLILVVGLVISTNVFAVRVISDAVDSRTTHCGWKMDSGTRIDIPVVVNGTDKICSLDLTGITAGSHITSATAIMIDPVWGRLESPPSTNFTFVVPTIPTVPSGLKLIP